MRLGIDKDDEENMESSSKTNKRVVVWFLSIAI